MKGTEPVLYCGGPQSDQWNDPLSAPMATTVVFTESSPVTNILPPSLRIQAVSGGRSTDGSKIAFATGPTARPSCVPLVPSCLSSVSYGSYKTTSKRAMNLLRGAAASCEQLIRKLVPRPLNVLGIQCGNYARDDLDRLESNSRTAKVRKTQAPTSLLSVAPCSHHQLPDVHARLFPCSLHSTDDVTPQPDQAAAVLQRDCLLGSGTFPPKWLQEINDQGQHSIRFAQPAAFAASAASTNGCKDPMDPSGSEDSGAVCPRRCFKCGRSRSKPCTAHRMLGRPLLRSVSAKTSGSRRHAPQTTHTLRQFRATYSDREAAVFRECLIRELLSRPAAMLEVNIADSPYGHPVEQQSSLAHEGPRKVPFSIVKSVDPCSRHQVPDAHATLFCPCSRPGTADASTQTEKSAMNGQMRSIYPGPGTSSPWLRDVNDKIAHEAHPIPPAANAPRDASNQLFQVAIYLNGARNNGAVCTRRWLKFGTQLPKLCTAQHVLEQPSFR
ncbi:uncharacterized protein LOC144124196 [Amblyomma americanum]